MRTSGKKNKRKVGDKTGGHLTVTDLLVAKLRCNPNNPRVHTPRQVRQIADSIKQFGFISPVVVR
jgi:ParB-like chromosome segregation protein Spo0J